MPLNKAADAIKRKIEEGQQEQLDRGIPAASIRNQLPPSAIPPGVGGGGSGLPTLAQGDLIYGDGAGDPTPLAVGTSNQTLHSNGSEPYWDDNLPTGNATGDLSGTYPFPTVVALQGLGISTNIPADGDMLAWNDSAGKWEPTAPTGGGGGGGGGTIYTSAYASPPSSPANGDIWIPSDSPYTGYRASGVWHWRYGSRPITLPESAGLSWVNQGGATLANNGGSLTISAPTSGSELRMQSVAVPGSSFKLRCGIARGHHNVNYAHGGIFVRDSASGKIITLALYQDPSAYAVMIQQYSGPSGGFNATVLLYPPGFAPEYLEIEETGGTRFFRVGRLGFTMQEIYSQAASTWLTTDECGFYVDSNNGTYPSFIECWDFDLQ